MNKYKESLGIILNKLPSIEKVLCKEYIMELQELVDKETLMKVKILGYDEDWLTGLKIAFGECPKCKFHVCDDEFYCRNCGQRVYFEEVMNDA